MRAPITIVYAALIAAISFSGIQAARADVAPHRASQNPPCENNPNITPSLRVCAFTAGDARRYQIDTRDGRHAELSVQNGNVDVLPSRTETVRVEQGQSYSFSWGVRSIVYRDAALDLDVVRDQKNRLLWIAHPMPAKELAAPAMCDAAGCSGGGKEAKSVPAMCDAAGCSGGGKEAQSVPAMCDAAGCSGGGKEAQSVPAMCDAAGCSGGGKEAQSVPAMCDAAGCSGGGGSKQAQ